MVGPAGHRSPEPEVRCHGPLDGFVPRGLGRRWRECWFWRGIGLCDGWHGEPGRLAAHGYHLGPFGPQGGRDGLGWSASLRLGRPKPPGCHALRWRGLGFQIELLVRLGASGAPTSRYDAAGVWTGEEFAVFGGSGQAGPLATGAAWSPQTETWRPLPRRCPLRPARRPSRLGPAHNGWFTAA